MMATWSRAKLRPFVTMAFSDQSSQVSILLNKELKMEQLMKSGASLMKTRVVKRIKSLYTTRDGRHLSRSKSFASILGQ